MELRTHKIELNPNNKQATQISQHCGYARVAYNTALDIFKSKLDGGDCPFRDQGWSVYEIKREFNSVKDDLFPWCRAFSHNDSKNAIHDLADALKRWKSGHNKFTRLKNRSGKCS